MMLFTFSIISLVFGLCNCQMDFGSMMTYSMLNGGGMNAAGSRGMAMAGLTGMTGDMSPMDLTALTTAVKRVIGNHASPDLALIQYASMQSGQPNTLGGVMMYLPFMVNIAKRSGLQMPDGTIQFPVARMNYPLTGVTSTGVAGNSKVLTMQRMQQIMNERAVRWFTNHRVARSFGGFVF